MPYITKLHIKQCRNVRDLDIDLSVDAADSAANGAESSERPKFRHLILTGPNGSGKSGVLEDVRRYADALLYPDSGTEDPYRTPNKIDWDTRENPNLCGIASTGQMFAVYLPARRSIHYQEVEGPAKLGWEPGRLRPADEASEQLLQFLVNKRMAQALAAEAKDKPGTKRIRDWFLVLQKHLRRLMEDPRLTLEFDPVAWNFLFRRNGYVFDLNTLADGHAAVLTILAELLLRVDLIRETRKDFSFEPDGVVIIDEIETHLHLSLQEKILPFLTELFPRFQFLVATHSPAVIASVTGAIVCDLGTLKQRLSDDYRGIPYGILMKDHFRISSDIDLDSTKKLQDLRALAAMPARSAAEERRLHDLADVLSQRSSVLATEVWMTMEGLAASSTRLGGDPS